MQKYKVASVFDIVKWDDDYTLEDFKIMHSHPSIEDVFLFHEDLLDGFTSMDEYKALKVNHIHRVFVVISISPYYTTNHEYGVTELDGWDWEVLILTSEDLGEVIDDAES